MSAANQRDGQYHRPLLASELAEVVRKLAAVRVPFSYYPSPNADWVNLAVLPKHARTLDACIDQASEAARLLARGVLAA